ncbi:hypothetical protein AA21291_1973 [Swaminathania salitolerans LMG 21291]|uniref:Uncharacterized protein n=1 Tax=Swaminathania salitolerans TaxID=182838 RepID=A0A511BNS1_9PROT|nr:hypothetical protein AA21291_1973 [Swaminathania salitolerans LMG 21291]GEL01905.1 hypothetical protein SSA02_10680 [Swaminathania salitolerans]
MGKITRKRYSGAFKLQVGIAAWIAHDNGQYSALAGRTPDEAYHDAPASLWSGANPGPKGQQQHCQPDSMTTTGYSLSGPQSCPSERSHLRRLDARSLASDTPLYDPFLHPGKVQWETTGID